MVATGYAETEHRRWRTGSRGFGLITTRPRVSGRAKRPRTRWTTSGRSCAGSIRAWWRIRTRRTRRAVWCSCPGKVYTRRRYGLRVQQWVASPSDTEQMGTEVIFSFIIGLGMEKGEDFFKFFISIRVLLQRIWRTLVTGSNRMNKYFQRKNSVHNIFLRHCKYP